jgi:hypothetical protein
VELGVMIDPNVPFSIHLPKLRYIGRVSGVKNRVVRAMGTEQSRDKAIK